MTSLQPRRQAYKREITLLSKGFSAPKAWPGGKITVYPWDSEVDAYVLEQAKANSQDNLLYGMLERVIDMNGASIDQFVFSEINSILLVSRSIQFDGTIEYQSSCPYCHAKDHELIKIPHELAPIGEKALDYPGFDEITLPDCKDVVRIRPLLVKDQKKIEMRDSDALLKFSDRKLQILFSIVTVNEGAPDTVDEAAEWYDALSPTDSRHLEERQVDLSPRLDNRLPHKCKKCTRDFHHTLLFDQEFFRPGGQGQPAPAPEKDVRTGVGREQGVRGRPTPPQRR